MGTVSNLGKLRHGGRHLLELRALEHLMEKKMGFKSKSASKKYQNQAIFRLYNAVCFYCNDQYLGIVWIGRKHKIPGKVSSQSITGG